MSLYYVLSVKAFYLYYLNFLFQPGLRQLEHVKYSLHCYAHSQRGIVRWDWAGTFPASLSFAHIEGRE